MTRVELQSVGKRYPARGRTGTEAIAVDDVTLEVAPGEIHAVIGFSGAGKSTLLRLVNGLERATSGRVLIDGEDITAYSESQLRAVRSRIGMIFQQFNLFHSKTVAKNVEYPLIVAGIPRSEREARVQELLNFVGLADHTNFHIEQLSGGQKQRVGIARALATNPGLLLADEATSALDPDTSREVLELLSRVNRELGITILLITHEMDVVREIAHRVTVMDGGRSVEQGDVFEVFSNPQAPTTQSFVSSALPSKPNPEHLRALREKHRGKLVSLTFRDGSVDQPIVFQTLADRGVGVNIVYGGISDVGGRTFGKLTLELIGDELQVEHAIAALGQQTELEVLA